MKKGEKRKQDGLFAGTLKKRKKEKRTTAEELMQQLFAFSFGAAGSFNGGLKSLT